MVITYHKPFRLHHVELFLALLKSDKKLKFKISLRGYRRKSRTFVSSIGIRYGLRNSKCADLRLAVTTESYLVENIFWKSQSDMSEGKSDTHIEYSRSEYISPLCFALAWFSWNLTGCKKSKYLLTQFLGCEWEKKPNIF